MLLEAINSHTINVISQIYDHLSRPGCYLEVKCECYEFFGGGGGAEDVR